MSNVYPINYNRSNQWSSIYYKIRIIGILVGIVILIVFVQLSNE